MGTHRNLLAVCFCIVVLAMRIGGAHVHLCLDGSEAPRSIHFVDAGLHHAEPEVGLDATDAHHDDVEVDVGAGAINKLPGLDLPFPAALFLFVFALFFASGMVFPRRRFAVRPIAAGCHVRPPLRGPPVFSFA